MAASRRSNLLMLQCSIVSKHAYRCNRSVPFQEAYRLRQSHGPEQVFKPHFRRPDRVRVDRHRQFARVPGSLACHLVQLGDGLAGAQAERARHRMEVSPSGSLTRRFPLAGGARHHEAVSRIIRPSIRTVLTPRAVLRLVLRQTEGLIGSRLRSLGLDRTAPDRSCDWYAVQSGA